VSLPRVMIGGPVRDREWSVPQWLGGLLDLDYPRDLLTLAILVNDSQDATFEACRWWCDRAKSEGFGRVVLAERNFGTTVDNNLRQIGGSRDYTAFAKARDAWVELARDERKLFSVDSDVQVNADTLTELVTRSEKHGVQMLSAVLRNHAGAPAHHTNCHRFRDDGQGSRWLEHDLVAWQPGDRTGVLPIDVTGACVLLDRDCFADGRSYTACGEAELAKWGEDVPFCDSLRAAGIQPHFAPDLRVTHWMEPPADLRFVRRPGWHLLQAMYHLHRATELEGSNGQQAA